MFWCIPVLLCLENHAGKWKQVFRAIGKGDSGAYDS